MRTRLTGIVASAKASKTLRVEVQRTYRHPVVGKYVKARTVCHVHDENEEAHEGDLVEIEESKPISKLKHWSLVRIVRKSKDAEAVRQMQEKQEAAEAEAMAAGTSPKSDDDKTEDKTDEKSDAAADEAASDDSDE